MFLKINPKTNLKMNPLLTLKTVYRSHSFARLPDVYEAIRKTCNDFAVKELKPIAGMLDKEKKFPKEQIKKLGELGMMSLTISEKNGGTGLDSLAYAIAMEEISYGCPSTSVTMSVHSSLYLEPIQKWGTEEQIDRFLRPYVKGEKLGCFALSESDNGSDAGAAKTTVTQLDNKKWLINGQKCWISSSIYSDAILMFATSDKKLKHKGISAFLVPTDTKGVSFGLPEDKLGIRASPTTTIKFDNVEIPKEFLLGKNGDGFEIAMKCLDSGRIGVAAQALGIARAALECAIEYSQKRVAFNELICNFQAIQFKIADMSTQLDAARMLTWKAASKKDEGLVYTKEAAMAKLFASETSSYVTHQAIQILGGMGYVSDMPVERHFRDARITEIYEGTSEILRLVIAKNILKDYNLYKL